MWCVGRWRSTNEGEGRECKKEDCGISVPVSVQ
jgi:hypothetical protein